MVDDGRGCWRYRHRQLGGRYRYGQDGSGSSPAWSAREGEARRGPGGHHVSQREVFQGSPAASNVAAGDQGEKCGHKEDGHAIAQCHAPVDFEEVKAARLVRFGNRPIYLVSHLGLDGTMRLTHG